MRMYLKLNRPDGTCSALEAGIVSNVGNVGSLRFLEQMFYLRAVVALFLRVQVRCDAVIDHPP